MLVENKVTMTPPQPPICPNCGASMDLIEPDEFFETYAYCCDECGIRTKECNTPDEAYATIKKQPYHSEQIKWERDVAIEQLEDHGISFGGLQEPIKFGHLLDSSPCWLEVIYEDGSTSLEVVEMSQWAVKKKYCAYYIGEEIPDNFAYDEYGKKWRCWAVKPTDEERNKTKWSV